MYNVLQCYIVYCSIVASRKRPCNLQEAVHASRNIEFQEGDRGIRSTCSTRKRRFTSPKRSKNATRSGPSTKRSSPPRRACVAKCRPDSRTAGFIDLGDQKENGIRTFGPADCSREPHPGQDVGLVKSFARGVRVVKSAHGLDNAFRGFSH